MSQLSASQTSNNDSSINHVHQRPKTNCKSVGLSKIVFLAIAIFNAKRLQNEIPHITRKKGQHIVRYITEYPDFHALEGLEKQQFYQKMCKHCDIDDELALLHAIIQNCIDSHNASNDDSHAIISVRGPQIKDNATANDLLFAYAHDIGVEIPEHIIAQICRFWRVPQIQFEWKSTLYSCDAKHFLAVAHSCLMQLNQDRNQKQKHVANIGIVLRYLQLIDMNGARFMAMRKPQFAAQLETDYILQRGLSTALYQRIRQFDFQSIKDGEICTIPISDKVQYRMLFKAARCIL